jgi:formylmethanofuran dehydrogenase subunit E
MAENLDFYLKKGEALHGDICGGIVLGTRLTLAAMRALGMDPAVRNKNLIVFVEVDRCMTDAVQAVTGCSLGHRTLKYVNYGKFGAVFYDLESKRAVRVTERKGVRKETQGDLAMDFRIIPDEELIRMEEVEINLDSNDLPGKPEKIRECQQCGELIFDGKEVNQNGRVLCRACADGAYYKPKSKQAAK